MSTNSGRQLDALWAHHHAEWRDPAQIVSQWREAERTDSRLLQYRVRGDWWETLASTKATLLVTREYEHLVMAVSVSRGQPTMSYLPMPHPSGLVVDRVRQSVYVASTRNPNQIFELRRADALAPGRSRKGPPVKGRPLIPTRSWLLPGRLYLHDLALIGGELHANAVGCNAIVRLDETGRYERVWWPRGIERNGKPAFERNYLQLNSIAAGENLANSFFSASTDQLSARRPGHANFPVKGRGVIFSGRTREPVVRGLTRPHSARLHAGRLWVDNSGYGEVGVAGPDGFVAVGRLPGWTRGLCFCGNVAFVGVSRVIPRFRQYAPGLDEKTAECGVHALDARTGRWLGSIVWPRGNQIFALDWMPSGLSLGFPFPVGKRRATRRDKALFFGCEY